MVPEYRVVILPEASFDIVRLFDFIANESEQNASLVATRLIDAIDSLNRFPHRCKIYVSYRDPKRSVKAMTVNPFIIYYRIFDDEKIIEVQTIRHGAQRQPRYF